MPWKNGRPLLHCCCKAEDEDDAQEEEEEEDEAGFHIPRLPWMIGIVTLWHNVGLSQESPTLNWVVSGKDNQVGQISSRGTLSEQHFKQWSQWPKSLLTSWIGDYTTRFSSDVQWQKLPIMAIPINKPVRVNDRRF